MHLSEIEIRRLLARYDNFIQEKNVNGKFPFLVC